MTLANYLQNVADDMRESGRECTADDYEQAAATILELTTALQALLAATECGPEALTARIKATNAAYAVLAKVNE